MKRALIAGLVALGLTGTAAAQGINYDYVGVDYAWSTRTSDINAWGVNGSWSPIDHLFLQAGAGRAKAGPFRSNVYSLGVGGYVPLSEGVHLVGSASYLRDDPKGIFRSSNGYGLDVGVRALLTSRLETEVGLDYTDFSRTSGQFGAHADLRYHFTPAVSASVGYQYTENAPNAYSVGVRFGF